MMWVLWSVWFTSRQWWHIDICHCVWKSLWNNPYISLIANIPQENNWYCWTQTCLLNFMRFKQLPKRKSFHQICKYWIISQVPVLEIFLNDTKWYIYFHSFIFIHLLFICIEENRQFTMPINSQVVGNWDIGLENPSDCYCTKPI